MRKKTQGKELRLRNSKWDASLRWHDDSYGSCGSSFSDFVKITKKNNAVTNVKVRMF